MLTPGPSQAPFPWMLQLRAGCLPLLSCLTLEQPFTCFPMPSAGQPDHGLQEGPESQAVWQPCLTGLCWQQPVLLGMELARVSLRLFLTALPHSVACSFLSACSLQVLGLGSIPRPTQQPQLNSRFFVEALHAARGNCERSLTLVGCRHFSPPTSARGSPRPQKGSGPPLSSRQGRAAW